MSESKKGRWPGLRFNIKGKKGDALKNRLSEAVCELAIAKKRFFVQKGIPARLRTQFRNATIRPIAVYGLAALAVNDTQPQEIDSFQTKHAKWKLG